MCLGIKLKGAMVIIPERLKYDWLYKLGRMGRGDRNPSIIEFDAKLEQGVWSW